MKKITQPTKIFIAIIIIIFGSTIKCFAACNTNTLNIANATYDKNSQVLFNQSFRVNCKEGFINPEYNSYFDIQCLRSTVQQDDGSISTKDEWMLLANIHTCRTPYKAPISNADIAIGCYKTALDTSTFKTMSPNNTKFASGTTITITCNDGYAASSLLIDQETGIVNTNTYQATKTFDVQCIDGKFYGLMKCLSACDLDILRSRIPSGQTINSKTSFAAPGDLVPIVCNLGGIIQTGTKGYMVKCVFDDDCQDISTTKCATRNYFVLQDSVSIVNKAITLNDIGIETDAEFEHFPTCSPEYAYCDNQDIANIKNIEDSTFLKNSKYTYHNGGHKVTCKFSSGILNANKSGFDYEGKVFRIFSCINGTWQPNPSELVCPDRDCTDNESCGYPLL